MNKSLFGYLVSHMVMYFFVAFGIVLGGAILGGLAAFLTRQPPFHEMETLAVKLKIWGMVGALGGTFDSFMQIERVILDGNMSPVIKQIIFIISAFIGADTGTRMIQWLIRGEPS
ncbi:MULTISPECIES: YtrH family sporulation protein [Aneurinibacillus]|uniref:Sporulation protein YtrH n=2 Tax=Aneurinibacillus thermoaerophilus TaxID=143495 RepID=A0A1G7WSR6_ANETH|nr:MULTISPECIES: YtrH family sporulation protein [Aneurinibacillus]MED0676232.1 YtrH family sporulation protein [Aneurinibacillus thermoaerophilus]MED0678164.1 YtrH family sporulation protein [Aneurinibacillus thermoaerophilus]MED0737650.1 YtrH family sporulation protein [Aneurinibacillus thermoaerophilus]MED0755642.1 YtrH family sporulation protein [Aneurinibacillus thermoaerophilus]MED0760029.1 YtrH family sporulation protein [Aneurinibacillus thermoaerophilus]